MKWLLWTRIKNRERDLDEEIAAHFRMAVQDRIESGESDRQAQASGNREFGNIGLVKEVTREMWGWTWAEQLLQDIRYGARMLRKNPGFAAAAVLTLALGIGANTAIFSVIDVLLLKTLPVTDPQQLAVMSIRNIRGESTNFSYPLFERLRSEQGLLSGLAASTGVDHMPVRISGDENTEETRVELVSGNFFEILGVNAKVGRVFTADDDRPSAGQTVAVLSHGFWEQRFNARPNVLGSILRIKNVPYTVVGVTPPAFFGNVVGESPEVWIPASTQPLVLPGRDWIHATSTDWLDLMARLRPGVNERQAQAGLQLVMDRLKAEPVFRKGMPEGARIVLKPGSKGFSELRERFAHPLLILMLAVSLVLLIACVNVANLILARTAARQRELAIRLAMGASGWRVMRLIVTENLLLSSLGAIGGLLLAIWSANALLPLLAERGSPPLSIHPDARMLMFTLAICLLTALLFSIQPALKATSRKDLTALKDSVPGAGRPRRALFGKGLAVLQVALSLMLVSGAALLSRSLLNLRLFDPGFARDHVLLIRIDPVSAGYRESRTAVLNRRLLESIRAIPGVISASLSDLQLMQGKNQTCCIQVPGYEPVRDERMVMRSLDVTPEYFATLGMKVLAGRDFTLLDGTSNPTPVIVNEAFANHYLAGEKALGRSFQVNPQHRMEIVGIVKDARYDGIREGIPPLVFFPAPEYKGTLLSLAVRTSADPKFMESSVRKAISQVDPALPIPDVVTIKALIDDSLAQERLLARLSSLFGILALGMAAVGLYGLMAYNVSRRTNEVGLRMALGARQNQVMAMIMGETIALLLLGSAIGLVGSLAATRAIASFLFGLNGTDPLTLAFSCAVLLVVGLTAGWIPARRASQVNPMCALRHE
jgi:predicted permease